MLTDFTQRWRNGRAYYRPARETINTRDYEVAEIFDDKTAKTFVEREHYSRSYVSARRRFGLYHRNGELCGVAVFSHPMCDKTITNIFTGTKATDSLELGRFVLLDSILANGESWFLARCREILQKDFIGIVTFSDDTPRTDNNSQVVFLGHMGTIYKCSNFSFYSRSTPRTLKLLPDGRVFSDRTIQKIRANERGWQYSTTILERYGATAAPEDIEERKLWLSKWLKILTRPLKHPGNLRYAIALDKKFKLPPSLPYPKIRFGDIQTNLF